MQPNILQSVLTARLLLEREKNKGCIKQDLCVSSSHYYYFYLLINAKLDRRRQSSHKYTGGIQKETQARRRRERSAGSRTTNPKRPTNPKKTKGQANRNTPIPHLAATHSKKPISEDISSSMYKLFQLQ